MPALSCWLVHCDFVSRAQWSPQGSGQSVTILYSLTPKPLAGKCRWKRLKATAANHILFLLSFLVLAAGLVPALCDSLPRTSSPKSQYGSRSQMRLCWHHPPCTDFTLFTKHLTLLSVCFLRTESFFDCLIPLLRHPHRFLILFSPPPGRKLELCIDLHCPMAYELPTRGCGGWGDGFLSLLSMLSPEYSTMW